eukprot:SAG31_NODE_4009_length_3668_cov_17.056598_1_plen_206_part_00
MGDDAAAPHTEEVVQPAARVDGGDSLADPDGSPTAAATASADSHEAAPRRARKLTGFVDSKDVQKMHAKVARENEEIVSADAASADKPDGTTSSVVAAAPAPAAAAVGAKKTGGVGGWRQRAAQKAMQLRTKADEAMKAANEQIAGYEIGARVAAASKAAGNAATQVQKKATQAFNELTLVGESGVNVSHAISLFASKFKHLNYI